ncbi:unnamed protein product [Ceutorhynchus assimilis]|uniref:Uncharacterized protein n=1 Tax=Ceutorhynchus assimilis TaxID=467358 RepID=A0A9N9QS09_9CUCU|nr:unnamed protein product [Ceutorhynchus assimilis]
MSPKRPVEKLSFSCTKQVTEFLLNGIDILGEKCIKIFWNYIDALPRKLRNEILISLFELTSIKTQKKWIAFCLFKFSCYKFDSRHVSRNYHRKFVYNLINVRYLNLSDAEITETILTRTIKRNPQLRVLIIPNKATNNVLKEITNLKHLKMLDISGNNQLTLEDLNYISSTSLEILTIGNSIISNLDFENLAFILQKNPNLKEIKMYDYMGKALLTLKSPYICKLNAIRDYKTSTKQIKAIIGICPNLKKLSLETPDINIFKHLQQLTSLQTLKLTHCQNIELNLKNLTLKTLQIHSAIINSTKLCLTIQNLLLKSCKLTHNDTICFRNLKTLELIDCNIKNKSTIMNFLTYANQLQRFTMSNDIGIDDEDIKLLCENKKLKSLETLWLSMAKQLTSDSVVRLMNHCDKLTSIGTLNGWNISKDEVNYLRCFIYFKM